MAEVLRGRGSTRAGSQDCSSVFQRALQTACWSWRDLGPSLTCRDREGQISLLGLSTIGFSSRVGHEGTILLCMPPAGGEAGGGRCGSSGSLRSTWCQPCDTKDSLSSPVDMDLGPQLMPLWRSGPSRSLTKGLLPTGARDGKGGSANPTSGSAAANTPLVQCPRVCTTVLSSCTSCDAPDNTERWRLLLSCSAEQTKAQRS